MNLCTDRYAEAGGVCDNSHGIEGPYDAIKQMCGTLDERSHEWEEAKRRKITPRNSKPRPLIWRSSSGTVCKRRQSKGECPKGEVGDTHLIVLELKVAHKETE